MTVRGEGLRTRSLWRNSKFACWPVIPWKANDHLHDYTRSGCWHGSYASAERTSCRARRYAVFSRLNRSLLSLRSLSCDIKSCVDVDLNHSVEEHPAWRPSDSHPILHRCVCCRRCVLLALPLPTPLSPSLSYTRAAESHSVARVHLTRSRNLQHGGILAQEQGEVEALG